MTVILTTQITSTVTSDSYGMATTFQTGSSAIPADLEENDTSSSNKTGVIVGGAIGGAAIILITAVIVIMLLRNKKKMKEVATETTQPTFEFIGSNIPAPRPLMATSTEPTPPSQARALTPCLSEVDGDNKYPVKPAEAPNVVYQPYRHQGSESSVSAYERNTILPYRPQFPTSVLPQHFDSTPSFLQLSEVDGISATSSQRNTNNPPERRQSRFAELDASHMSMQSGPIPEWNARELP